ncbi:MAG: DUF4282 domain-containing protein [Streptosporangiaceae bacterium]
MTDQSSSPGRPDDWNRGGYDPGEQYADEQYYGAGTSGSPRPGPGMPGPAGSGYGTPGSGGVGAARPSPGMPGQGTGPGMATTPIWQGTPPPGPGQAGPGQGGWGQGGPGLGAPPPAGAPPMGPPPMGPPAAGMSPMAATQGADARGFLGALFDFSFTSFVTTRIIKVLYVLIMILTVLVALVYTFYAFNASPLFGFLTLVIGDPLFIIIVMAFWRLVLESFVVRFRIAEDVRALRERADR